jgi:hypothetical protein
MDNNKEETDQDFADEDGGLDNLTDFLSAYTKFLDQIKNT